MPSLMVSLAGKPQANYPITRPRTRIGRWTGNDIVLDSRSVSGAHAVLVQDGSRLEIEDLGSRNGTFVRGARIVRSGLDDGGVVTIGDYTLTLVANRNAMAYEPTMLVRPGAVGRQAYLQRLSGAPLGETIALNKIVCAIGRPGECILTFIRRGDDVAVRFTDGPVPPRLNGVVFAGTPVRLNPGDVLETDSGRFQFLVRDADAAPA